MSEILNDNLTLVERGLLITILLLKDSDSKLTLAKVKAKIKIAEVREELIKLHDAGFIEWSGYKTAKRIKEEKGLDKDLVHIVEFMNELYSRNFDVESTATTKNLVRRMKTCSIEDIKLVIANRYVEWKDDIKMKKHLNPTTIFRPSKFDKYLEVAKRTREGEKFIQAKNINLQHGDEITIDVVNTFIDEESYNIKTFRLEEGRRTGLGMEGIRLGKDIKKSLKIQERLFLQGSPREFTYTYIKR